MNVCTPDVIKGSLILSDSDAFDQTSSPQKHPGKRERATTPVRRAFRSHTGAAPSHTNSDCDFPRDDDDDNEELQALEHQLAVQQQLLLAQAKAIDQKRREHRARRSTANSGSDASKADSRKGDRIRSQSSTQTTAARNAITAANLRR